jgi:hypothetical protein
MLVFGRNQNEGFQLINNVLGIREPVSRYLWSSYLWKETVVLSIKLGSEASAA